MLNLVLEDGKDTQREGNSIKSNTGLSVQSSSKQVETQEKLQSFALKKVKDPQQANSFIRSETGLQRDMSGRHEMLQNLIVGEVGKYRMQDGSLIKSSTGDFKEGSSKQVEAQEKLQSLPFEGRKNLQLASRSVQSNKGISTEISGKQIKVEPQERLQSLPLEVRKKLQEAGSSLQSNKGMSTEISGKQIKVEAQEKLQSLPLEERKNLQLPGISLQSNTGISREISGRQIILETLQNPALVERVVHQEGSSMKSNTENRVQEGASFWSVQAASDSNSSAGTSYSRNSETGFPNGQWESPVISSRATGAGVNDASNEEEIPTKLCSNINHVEMDLLATKKWMGPRKFIRVQRKKPQVIIHGGIEASHGGPQNSSEVKMNPAEVQEERSSMRSNIGMSTEISLLREKLQNLASEAVDDLQQEDMAMKSHTGLFGEISSRQVVLLKEIEQNSVLEEVRDLKQEGRREIHEF